MNIDGGSVTQNFEIAPWLACPACSAPIGIVPEQTIQDYFMQKPLQCASCGKLVDIYAVVCRTIRSDFFWGSLTLGGARQTIVTVDLQPNAVIEVPLVQYGVPDDARVLRLNYTTFAEAPPPQANNHLPIFPLEVHGNSPARHILPNRLLLYGATYGAGTFTPTKCHILVVWAPHSQGETALQSIVDALDAYSSGRLSAAIIPANVAVELTLAQVMSKALVARGIGEKKTRDFLTSDATYSHQLNVLLPILFGGAGQPHLDKNIVGQLNRLRSLRNQIAHSGETDSPLTREEVADCIAAALFGLHYLRML
jgi:hypothetical protein